MLISGFIIILFKNRKDIEASWLEGCVPSFGLLRLGYDVAVHYPAKTVVDSGNAVADSPEQMNSVTPLGLKVKLQDASQGIVVPTHAFVDVKTPQENIARKETGWLARIQSILSRAASMKIKDCIKMGSKENSPLGKSVWFVAEPKEVGIYCADQTVGS